MGDDLNARLRRLPGVDRVIASLPDEIHPRLAARVARAAVDEARSAVKAGGTVDAEAVIARARDLASMHSRALLRPVINATGVLIHTNLGRVPLGPRQLDAARSIASSYSNLEYDLVEGTRGTRHGHAAELLTLLTGAEAGVVVNNNAAAVLMALAGLCAGREVVISRGELVEIGGEFRIPDVMEAAGVGLVEVGTTNRTHLSDYERAIGENTAAVMKVHPSNYRITGFTASVRAADLARLAHERGILFLHDLGSGLVAADESREFGRLEPSAEDAIDEGADVVTFSGDKLLGGPQAGIVLGRKELVARVSRHPLMRAVRPDKVTLALLQETMQMYLDGTAEAIPLRRLAAAPAAELEARATRLVRRLADRVPQLKVEAVATASVSGGGSLPGSDFPSWALAVTHGERSADEVAAALRGGEVPVIGRIDDDRLLLDLRTVFPEQDEALERLVLEALG